MRLFIAIQLNDDLKDELEDMQYIMQSNGIRGNFTRRENLHMTLSFIGEYPDPFYVKEILDGISFEPFTIRNEGMGSFGNLWWTGISSSKELEILARRVRRALADADIPFDRKKFRPHITLIRKPGPEGVSMPGGAAEYLGHAEMVVDHISLMRSDRTKAGMKYTEI